MPDCYSIHVEERGKGLLSQIEKNGLRRAVIGFSPDPLIWVLFGAMGIDFERRLGSAGFNILI